MPKPPFSEPPTIHPERSSSRKRVLFTLSDRIYTTDLSAPDWAKLSQGFGNADDLPRVLAELSPEPKDPIWKDLWNRVYDQCDIFSASPNLLPGSYEVAKDSLAHNQIQAHAVGPRLRKTS